MRPSNREKILDAATAVVSRDGIAAVTFEAVAEESGISRGGLLYHFRTKEELLLALHEYLAKRWDERLSDALGMPYDDATPDQRLAAYVHVGANMDSRSVMPFMIDATRQSELQQPWSEVLQRWLPDLTDASPDDERSLMRLLAIFAADGLWVSDSIAGPQLGPELRAAVAAKIGQLLE